MKIKAKYKFKVHKKTKQNLTWEEAKAYCKSLGDGWRIPTRVELLIMYEAKEEIKGFVDDFYWSSTEYRTTSAYGFRFGVGYASFTYKIYTYSVRAVKDC